MKPHTPPPRSPDAGPMPAPFMPPPPRKIYNIVDPSALARVYAAAYTAMLEASRGNEEFTREMARAAVRDFVRLMREDLDDDG